MALVPQIVDTVDIPVIAAGGIADGRQLAAALMLGAVGVQVGTRFLVAAECTIAQEYKDRVLKAKDIDTVYDILAAGTVKAAETTNETLAQVRKAMRIDYFTDRSIVKEWETLLRKANQ